MSMFSIASSNVHAGPGDRRLERVEVDDHQVDRLDALGLQRGEVVGDVAAGEDAAVQLGVERLDPAAEDLGLAGVGRDLGHLQAGLDQCRARAAAGQQVDPESRQGTRQIDQTAFLGDAQQGPADGDDCVHVHSGITSGSRASSIGGREASDQSFTS